jgi:glycosyltransferase involved in cell wall biosynthesis
MLVNADITDRQRHEPESPRGPHRRADFYELAELLGAEMLDWSTVQASFIGRNVQRLTNWYVAAAVLAFLRHRRYQLIWCDGESAGSILALLFKTFRVRKPLMMIGISPTRRAMWIMIRVFKVDSHITKLFAMCSWAVDTLVVAWRVPHEKVELLPYQVDVDFFNPQWAEPEHCRRRYIVAVGRESRDYETLVQAVEGLEVDLIIALGSSWAHSERDRWRRDAPSNVSVTTENYVGLRNLYAGSAFVVIPLREIELQNGITAIQEAMSMGKAVVTSRTRGQGDLLADEEMVLQDGSGRFTGGYFARYFAPNETELHGPTGIYVPPGNVAALRDAIERLLANSDLAAEMGARARSVCERVVSLNCFLERVATATKPYLN